MAEANGPTHLTEELEDAVLRILEGDDNARDSELAELCERHPHSAVAIRNWLVAAGVSVGDWHRDDDSPHEERDDQLPRPLADYRLDAIIGRGGFGTVYRAEQQRPICRQVAIKVLNPGMDSREILARFTAEREALNRMDHAGIARLLDAGTTPNGRPFFVMELVEGPTLVSYCRREMLAVRQRIALFLQVCDAMLHAHQKSVLHRDLSSNNVLVHESQERAQPKIIDFGIAKSLADPLLQGGAMTFQGTLMGTPEFMSPEQAVGSRDIDTRADVYSLGAQLFELLTDQLPIPGVVLRAQGVAGMAQVIESYRPPRASDVAPKPRRSQVRGDLDGILQKALAKDRDERYAGVGELADDLRRHLRDEPVQVTTPTSFYRLRKYVRRHRGQAVGFTIAAIALLVTLAALAVALADARKQRHRAEQAQHREYQKADEGFRLLANQEPLDLAIAAERELPPPWPRALPAYDAWLATYAVPLAAERDKARDRIDALLAQQANEGGQLQDRVDRHLLRALQPLLQRLTAFCSEDGLAAQVRARKRYGTDRLAPLAQRQQDAWQRAFDAIKQSDGVAASKSYSGLRIPALPGLMAIGCHPRTKLWQFLDLRTHAADAPLPERDPDTGDLVLTADSGVIFVLLPPGDLTIGARRYADGLDRNDPNAEDHELDGDDVRLHPYLIAQTEMTNAQWARLLADGSTFEEGEDLLPISHVSWQQVQQELPRWGMQLPTEAQWEYACRAGQMTPWSFGDDIRQAPRYGRFRDWPHTVAEFVPNGFGLFDMHGNVAEWCRDAMLRYDQYPARDGDGLRVAAEETTVVVRVTRGGSAYQDPMQCRSTSRDAHAPDAREPTIGVRAVRALQ